MIGYKTAIVIVALIPLVPAIIVGGGFVIGIVFAGVIIIVGLGGPKLWQLHNNKSLGAKGRNNDIRDIMAPSQSSRENPEVERPGDGREER